jgi:CBS domain-containing protein
LPRFAVQPLILSANELISFVTGNAQLVAGRIDRAANLGDLTIASREINDQVRLLRRQGVKIEAVAEIVSDVDRRLIAKVFDIVAPRPSAPAAAWC